jgi:hypothetical protein
MVSGVELTGAIKIVIVEKPQDGPLVPVPPAEPDTIVEAFPGAVGCNVFRRPVALAHWHQVYIYTVVLGQAKRTVDRLCKIFRIDPAQVPVHWCASGEKLRISFPVGRGFGYRTVSWLSVYTDPAQVDTF